MEKEKKSYNLVIGIVALIVNDEEASGVFCIDVEMRSFFPTGETVEIQIDHRGEIKREQL